MLNHARDGSRPAGALDGGEAADSVSFSLDGKSYDRLVCSVRSMADFLRTRYTWDSRNTCHLEVFLSARRRCSNTQVSGGDATAEPRRCALGHCAPRHSAPSSPPIPRRTRTTPSLLAKRAGPLLVRGAPPSTASTPSARVMRYLEEQTAMATVANNAADDSPGMWLVLSNFVLSLVQEARHTWFCRSWVPFIRCIVTIVIVVVVTAVARVGVYLLTRQLVS